MPQWAGGLQRRWSCVATAGAQFAKLELSTSCALRCRSPRRMRWQLRRCAGVGRGLQTAALATLVTWSHQPRNETRANDLPARAPAQSTTPSIGGGRPPSPRCQVVRLRRPYAWNLFQFSLCVPLIGGRNDNISHYNPEYIPSYPLLSDPHITYNSPPSMPMMRTKKSLPLAPRRRTVLS
eukprot:SAG25_NODE_19_length_23408_cov_10.997040_25_plen_180_part_00